MEMKNIASALFVGVAVSFAHAAVTITSPADYATVTVMPSVMRDFRSTFATGKKWSLVSSSTLGSAQRVEWQDACRASQSAVALAWSGTGSTKCTVKVYRVQDGKEVFSTTSTTGKASFPDAEIGRNYRWTVTYSSTTATGHFYVNRIAPRMMNSFSGIGNSRDLGGWTTDSGKVVKQGLVFRCEEWDFVDSATGLYKDGCTPKSYWSDTVGVNLDIDLRAKVWVNSYYMPANDSRAALDKSPLDLDKNIRRFRTEDAGTSSGAFPGAGGFNAGGKVSGDSTVYTADQFKRAIAYAVHQFGNRANYPILFHCSQGKDRTGALAYLLSGLLGVSEDDRDLDFVFTYAWDAGEYKLSKWDMDTIRDTVKACSGATFKDKCLTYVKNCYAKTTSPKLSATDAENDIATFRSMMLEDPEEAATDPSGGGGDEESFVYENYYWMRDGGGSTLSDGKSYWYKDPEGQTKWPTDQQNIVNNPNAAVYLWPTAAHPYAYPAAGAFTIGKLVSRNPYGGSVGLGNTPKGYFTNTGHGVTDRPLWVHQSGVAGAERLRVYLEAGTGTGSVQIWTNARLNLSAFESKNENVYLDFPSGKCDGATVCFYDLNGSQSESTVAWIQGGQAGTAQNLIVSNALLTVQRADKTSGVEGALNLEFALGSITTTANTMMTVKGGFKMNAGSTVRVNAGGKPAGTYKLLTVGSGKTLTVPTATVSGAKVVGCASGLAGTVALNGSTLSVTIAKATDPQPVAEVPEPVPTEAFDAAHTIVCYGDSLTWGECATEITMDGRSNFFEGRLAGVPEVPESYPYWLSGMIPSSYNVINQARSGSQACNITSWSGDQPVTVKRAFTLPAVGSVSVSTNFVFKNGPWGEWGGWAMSGSTPAKQQDNFNRWAGFVTPIFPLMEPYDAEKTQYSVTGTLGGRHVRLQGVYPTNITVTVFGSGTAKTVAAGSEFVPDNELVTPYKDAIRVICAGANDASSSNIDERYATIIKPLLQAFAAKGGKYLIVSPSVNTGSAAGTSATAIEQQMASDFGDHYLNLRLRMENDAKATATALGVPISGGWKSTDGTGLKAEDGTHFNSKGYKVMAEFIRQKLVQLNYISSEVQHEHSWGAWTVKANATKASAGRATRTCADCGETEERTLPQKWDYLETDSAGYLGTGYVPNLKTTEVAFDVRFPDGTSTSGGNALCCANAYVAYLLGERTVWPADYENALNLSHDPNKIDYYNCARLVDPTAACGPALPVITDTESRHALRFCGNQATVDGTDCTGTKAATDAQASSSLMLFAAKQAVKSQTSYGMMRKFVYGVTIKENGVLVRNYRPALDANGRATLFDDVTLTYATGYDNAGFGVDNDSGADPEPVHEHSWSDWTEQTAATKTADGRATRSCSCGASEERALPKLWDYLETDASGYLGTGYVPNLKTTEVAFDVRFPDGGNALCCANAYVAYLFGERTDWPSDYENALNLSHDPTKVDYYNCARLVDPTAACGPAISKITDTESRHALRFCGNQATVDGATYTGTKAATDAAASSSLMLFAAKQEVKSQMNYGKMRKFVYGVTIRENGELVRSYRPALNENGDATLFDDVTKTYAPAFEAGGFKAVNESGSVDPEEYGAKDTKAATYVWKSGVSGPWHHTTSWTSATGTYGIPNHATYATASFPASLVGGETVTISGSHFVKALDFANTTALTVNFAGGLLTVPTCAVGREGPTTLAFSGATPELVLTKGYVGRDNVIGNGADAATQATLRFTLPEGGWETPPIRTTGNDAPLFLGIGTKLVIDATAMAAPSGNAEVTNILISATDGVRFFNADSTDTLIPDSLYEAAEITCGEGKKGLLKTVDGNVAFILRNAAWQPEDVPQPENPDIYLLIGQSNMAGYGEGECDAVATERIVKWESENERWIPATDPLVSDAKVGLGCSFARNLADRETDRTVALINVAVGGTSLDQWQKGGVFYTRAVTSVQTALAKGGALKGILWHQGCEDAVTKELAESYAARLATLVADLRADLGDDVPFVCGELGQFLDANLWGYVEWRTVNAQLAAAATAIPNAALVSSEELEANGDNVHFTAASQRTFGVRYAEAMWALQHPDVPPGPTPGGVTTNAMANASWGYEIHGLGMAGNEVALVYTNASEGANMSWSVPTGVSSFDFLVVGGGGGGGGTSSANCGGGGGGAGAVRSGTVAVSGGESCAVVVGKGGAAGTGKITSSGLAATAGGCGGLSSLTVGTALYDALGGGGGGQQANAGLDGGCGGGGGSKTGAAGAVLASSDGNLYGNVGGAGATINYGTYTYPGAGGGGASLADDGKGRNPSKVGTSQAKAGDGGAGVMSAITGEEIAYGGGGGGGASKNDGVCTPGAGGLGGGGVGYWKSNQPAGKGVDGLGGGGGGAGNASWGTNGARGGSGVVVIRYVDPGVQPAEPELKPGEKGGATVPLKATTREAAEAEAETIAIRSPNAEIVSDEDYSAYFTRTVAEVGGVWTVTAELDPVAVAPEIVADEELEIPAIVVGADGTLTVNVRARPGLYYGVKAADTLEALKTATVPKFEQATEDGSLQLSASQPEAGATSQFCVVVVSATDGD